MYYIVANFGYKVSELAYLPIKEKAFLIASALRHAEDTKKMLGGK